MDHSGKEVSIRNLTASQLAKRIAFAATVSFGATEYYDREFSFLAPLLAVQMLAALPAPPKLGQAIAIPAVIYASTSLALGISTLFLDTPAVMLGLVALVIWSTFYGLRRGVSSAMILFIQMPFCFVPVLSTLEGDLASEFSDAFLWSSIAAVLIVCIAHLFFPSPTATHKVSTPPPPKPSGLEPAHAARIATSDTLILIPALFAFVSGSSADNIVILMIMLSLLRAIKPDLSRRMAIGILLANVLGGILAVAVHQFVILSNHSFLLFLLLVLAASLWFGGGVARGGAGASIYALAFGTFLLILGLGISPVFGTSEELLSVRVFKIAIASLYTIGALSLVLPLRHENYSSEKSGSR